MNPIKLLRETDQVAVAIACGNCGQHWVLHESTERYAAECCDPAAKEAAREKMHSDFREKCAKEDASRRTNATRVPYAEYTGGMLFWDGIGVGEGYFTTLEDLIDTCESNDVEPPTEVWGTWEKKFALSSASQLIADEIEGGEYHDGIEYDVDATPELEAAIKVFNEECSASSFYVDHDVLVILPERTS